MKPFFIEKQHSCVIYIDAQKMSTICRMADLIEDKFPESVIEVTHLRNAMQGSIILSKDCTDYIDKIKKLVNEFEN